MTAYYTGTGGGLGEELHQWGDPEPDPPTFERHPAEQDVDVYNGRDTMVDVPPSEFRPEMEFADVGELMELGDRLHETGDSAIRAMRQTEKRAMTPEQFVEFVQQAAQSGDAGAGGEQSEHGKHASTSPSHRVMRNAPQSVVDQAANHMLHRQDDFGGEDILDRDDQAALNELLMITEERGLEPPKVQKGAAVKQAEFPPAAKKPEPAGDDEPSMSAKPDEKKPMPKDPEMAEDEALDRIEDALDDLDGMGLSPEAQDPVDEIADALADLHDIQDDEAGGAGGHKLPMKGKHDDKDADDGDPLEKIHPAHMASKIASAIREPQAGEPAPVRPTFNGWSLANLTKSAAHAEELPFDIFANDAMVYTQSERNLATLRASRAPEGRVRFAHPQPQLVSAALGVLKQAFSAFKGYTIEHFDLQRVVSTKVASADGSIVEGAFEWHVILADHLRHRRGSLEVILPITQGTPALTATLLADGQRIAITREAIDRHLNVRRDASRTSNRAPSVELSNFWEA